MPALRRIDQIPRAAVVNPTRQAIAAAALYVLLCSSYIAVSGYFVAGAVARPRQLYVIETIKGVAFIVVTGALFYAISFLRYRKIRRQEETIIVQERALIQAERRLVAAMSAATVAHDLNNLLMTLSGLVEGLKGRERDDPFLLSMREGVEVGIEKLSHLAKRLMSTVRRAVPEEDVVVDVKAALLEMIAILQKHPDCRSTRVTSDDLAPLTLVLNRTLFEEAVLNLLINAAQAAGPAGQIEVHLTTEAGVAMLEIHDSGPGVPDGDVKDIFEPCFTTKPDGTGIGLLAVMAFAASCDASVSVGRAPLGGALFQLRIPIQEQPTHQ
jgi:two-component system sensor histidine kinase HydH